MTDEYWMGLALHQAELAARDGEVPVGAVLLAGNGSLLAVGRNRPIRAKDPSAHAEIQVLRTAAQRLGNYRLPGAKLYVTLEPCSMHGRTPPCTGAIRRAGIQRVFYGSSDVDPRNAGRACEILKKGGIRVTSGVLKEECDRLNEDYRHWTLAKKPWVILKMAMTLDGALAVPGRKWITSPQARAEVQRIRAGCDAILV
ncbi:MAG: bifunctional diaminohydroxyphosphoribosylaminopyrimidine deaminase/5-amino-6-(5-phosphoribosylamino)uracil reductase RibD, partial [Betaproteobacteria bacterium]|nr:bifunctional diaminohydroxyphosphoribosylaminopyrimidine deaminase/5-amino-6-(5-phosphoribosylamino)uracil reductase RibD [Betaproteobacteria bacterium]